MLLRPMRPLALHSLLAALALITAPPGRAQETVPDTAGVLRTVARAREALRDLPALWRIDPDGIDWLFVTREHALLTGRREGAERLTPVTLPSDAPRANNAYALDGRRVAMVVLPLTADTAAAARLLVHEAMHTFQPEQLPHPGNTEPMAGGDFLDGATGRTWLFLELRAIARALEAQGPARREAARDALLFRARRDSLALPEERERLAALDLAEGIPEYTGWRLTGTDAATLIARLDSASTRSLSWVRGVGYYTGPAYGYLLDALAGADWHPAWQAGEPLPRLLSTVLGSTPFTEALDARARRYGGDALRRAEVARETAQRRRLDSLRSRFVSGPVLRLIPGSLQVTFDPNGQTPLGDDGTVMGNFRWAGADSAELVAPAGALVSPTWSWIQVPLGADAPEPGVLAESRVVTGDGWRLALPRGWQVRRVGTRLEVRPPG